MMQKIVYTVCTLVGSRIIIRQTPADGVILDVWVAGVLSDVRIPLHRARWLRDRRI